MYLHAGAGVILRDTDIIGIFDLDGKMTTPDTAEFLRAAERRGITVLAGDDLPKCFVLAADSARGGAPKKEKVVFSRISAKVLAARGDDLTGI